MVELAVRKITFAADGEFTFSEVRWRLGDILRDVSCLSSTILKFQSLSLGTAQRVFLKVNVMQQGQQLGQRFAALQHPGTLIIDVGHRDATSQPSSLPTSV